MISKEHLSSFTNNRLKKQKKAFQSFDLSLKSCEKRVHDLDEESLQKFSAVGSTGNELKKQLDDLMVSGDCTESYCTNVSSLTTMVALHSNECALLDF